MRTVRTGVQSARSGPLVHVTRIQHQRHSKNVVCFAQNGSLLGCRFRGVGSSVPEKILTNEDLAKLVDTTDDWIESRTGIKRRHILSEGETLTSHAAKAVERALEMSGLTAADVDMILMSTSTPEDSFGSACTVSAYDYSQPSCTCL
jgi:hypothetical protein